MKSKFLSSVLAALAASWWWAVPALAHDHDHQAAPHEAMAAQSKHMQVLNPWARATVTSGQNGAAYFVLRNIGTDDVLLSASSDVAHVVELHTHIHDQGVMRMRKIPSIPIKAHMDTAFKPGGLHVMLIDLKQILSAGESIALTLEFAKAGKISFKVPIKTMQTMSMSHAH